LTLRRLLPGLLALALALPAHGQQVGQTGRDAAGNVYTFFLGEDGQGRWFEGRAASGPARTIQAERYVPTIWTDPDGCQHWVMDDGAEGYMTPNVGRDGRPVCNRAPVCGVMRADQLFASDSAQIHAAGRADLLSFFRGAGVTGFGIVGHTDSQASDAYNLDLSMRRADAVARVAREAGGRVIEVRGYGERIPVATNASAAGRAANRRVEITCYR
jgi:outer membrane protein OmpA-like peptidoglycan-associated protein